MIKTQTVMSIENPMKESIVPPIIPIPIQITQITQITQAILIIARIINILTVFVFKFN